jgi:hypothetical protein
MFRNVLVCALLMAAPLAQAATHGDAAAWKTKVTGELPLLGHRNWILVVDSAYPLQTSPGVETVETDAGMMDVLRFVLGAVNESQHVRPDIDMDAELPFVPDQDAPGASEYRARIAQVLHGYRIESLPHETILARIDEVGKSFHVLVLKTNVTIPYTSVFIRLNCRYWSDEAEARMRAKMKAAGIQ